MNIERECFSSHMGLWLVEPSWGRACLAALRCGQVPSFSVRRAEMLPSDGNKSEDDPGDGRTVDGVRIIPINGAVTKGSSKLGTSSVDVRRQVRQAVADPQVRGILLHIDSPGGHVAGTDDLAAAVVLARGADKPVFAQIDDLGASAAYWVASQAGHIAVNPSGEVGSIGTLAIVEDTSGAAEMAGIKVHVITTGPFKAVGVDGVPVTEAQLDYIRERVEAINEQFIAAVSDGRSMTKAQVRKLADGKLLSARQAIDAGLVDKVARFEDTLELAVRQVNRPARSRRAEAKVRMLGLDFGSPAS
jgi:protease-4